MDQLKSLYHIPRRSFIYNFSKFLHRGLNSNISSDSTLVSKGVDNPILCSSEEEFNNQPDFVADPFILPGTRTVFFEIFSKSWSPTAKIGWGELSRSFDRIEFKGIALEDDYHLSFPYVFHWEDDIYMVPDIWNKDGEAPTYLYQMCGSETEWERVNEILPGNMLHDVVLMYYNDRWWAFGSKQNEELHVFHSKDLLQTHWKPHKDNPVRVSPKTTRPAGRPLKVNGEVFLFFQDCSNLYGECVKATKLHNLSVKTFDDSPVHGVKENFVGPGTAHLGWNSGRMHHVDFIREADGESFFITDGAITTGNKLVGGPHWSIGVGKLPAEVTSGKVSQVF